jgi:o-succinylbenzoate synthase
VAAVPASGTLGLGVGEVTGLFPSGRLRSVDLVRVCVPLSRPIESAHGVEHDRWSILVRVEGVDGAEGWGECPALAAPTYTGEWHEGAWSILLNHLGPAALAGRSAGVRGHPMAVSAIEGALIDLELRRRGISLAEAVGATRPHVPVCAVVGIAATTDALLDQVDARVAAGYRSVKLKIRPGHDLEPLAAVREQWPELALAADANGSYDPSDHAALAALDELGLAYLEQPLDPDDLVGAARLADAMQTPVALDESASSLGAIAAALAIGPVGAVSLKPARLGGLVASVDAHALLVEQGVPMWCGGMFELGVGRAAALAVAGLPGCSLPTDVGPTSEYLAADVVVPFSLRADGTVEVPRGPGTGCLLDADLLDDVTIARRTITG